MNKKRLYSASSAVTSLVGVGVFLGYSLANGTSKTPIWIGGILIFLGAVALGMTISTREVNEVFEKIKK